MITLTPIGYVRNRRTDVRDDNWGAVESRIELVDGFGPECLEGLGECSHAEVIFHFDRVSEESIERGARRPRGNPDWPMVGIFAQRAKARPNRLGATIVEIIRCEGNILIVKGLDAIDGTPVLDIKPVLAEFLPRSPVRQPAWSHELMRDYW
jgi:tRNA-Thr(GGU) m(6)t(6)A37 methyltransferase TsaA